MRLSLLLILLVPFTAISQNNSELMATNVIGSKYASQEVHPAGGMYGDEARIEFGLMTKPASVKIHPNPFSSDLYVTLYGNGSSGKVLVYDILGNVIVKGDPFQLSGGSGTWEHNVSSWHAGTYVVRILHDDTVVKSLRFVKN